MKWLTGHFLVASPKLVDPNFFHSVVLIVQHNEEGALGLILNRPLSTRVKEMWEEVSEGGCEVEGVLYQGGPCEGPLMVVHEEIECSELKVMEGVYFCTRREAVERLIEGKEGKMRFFVSYAGWTAGQLEAEMETGSWLVTPATVKGIFEGDEHQWTDLVRALSRAAVTGMVDPRRIPDDPSVN